MKFLRTLALAALFLPAACVTTPNGKPQVSTAKVGADLQQGAAMLALANAVYAVTPNPNATVLADLKTAQVAVSTTANDLVAGNATTGDLAANITAANTALNAAIDGLQTADPTDATVVKGYRTLFLTALQVYNLDAPAAGVPVIPNLPTS